MTALNDSQPNDLVAAAKALAPKLSARAREAELLRRIPDSTVRDFVDAELCKLWIPETYGGLERDLHTGLAAMFEIARACTSSSWCLSVWQQHAWVVALFPETAQKETIGIKDQRWMDKTLTAVDGCG